MRFVVTLLFACSLFAQKAQLRPAERIALRGPSDSNNPSHWVGNTLHVYMSNQAPWRSEGPDQFHLSKPARVHRDAGDSRSWWIESTWVDDDGTIYAWYHFEPAGLCPGNNLTAPKIGALRAKSSEGPFEDLGIVLEGTEVDCSAKNGFFVGGHGDFSVIPDAKREYLYFLFGSYEGEAKDQGVAVARMRFADRNAPAGKVYKWVDGKWASPGLKGRLTPIFPASISWKATDANAFWGPSVHWNTYLSKYVMLLNRNCCAPGWVTEGIYVSYNSDLSNPKGWSEPVKLLDLSERKPVWYPQVIGLDAAKHESDKLAGRVARFWLHGKSDHEIVFEK